MNIKRVALIYDNRPRAETTGLYCQRALHGLVDVVHFLPDQVDRIPRTGFDLYVTIDDGLRHRQPADLHPCAWWVIDTHMDPVWAEQNGRAFDWLFAAQRDGADTLSRAGHRATWLPLACDPEIHRSHRLTKRWDVSFVGRIAPGPRHDLVLLLRQHFPNGFTGQAYFDEYARILSQSRLGFNRSVMNDVNMRVFETLACGTLLITNDLRDNGQEELLVSDRHLLTYQGPEEMLDKIGFYVTHDEIRERLARAGQAAVLERHTYRHRMTSLLETVSRDLQTSVSVPAMPLAPVAPQQSEQPQWLDLIDIVIKTFLRPQALRRLLDSIDRHYPAAHMTIADDGGLDTATDSDSMACRKLLAEHPRWKLHSLPFAAGVTPGRNFLIDHTQRPYLLFLDDDFCFTPETRIDQFLERMLSDPQIGVVAGACIDVVGEERRHRNSGGTLEITGDTLFIDTAGWRDRAAGLRDYVPQFGLFRRNVFRKARWEGEMGGEHYDFCLQLQRSGWKVVQDLSVQVDHHHFTPALPGYAERRFNCTAGQQWLLRKWGLQRIVQDGEVIIELAEGKVATTLGVPSNGKLASHSALAHPETRVPGSPTSKLDPPSSTLSTRRLPEKDSSYFDLPRPEVVALIPCTARSVLDIGCGAGALGALLKQRQQVEVVGIELQPDAAALARQRLDQVIEQNVEDPSVDFPAGSFDCVVCADVLEHTREPAPVLEKINHWLAPGGCLVASIPNVRHHSVVASLLDGNWTYETAGLLDNDHVRFFTRREIEKLLFRAGFEIQEFRAKPGPGFDEWNQSGRPGNVAIGSLQISGLAPEAAQEFFTYQYLVVARPAGRPPHKLTSIIIVTHNQFV